MIFGAVLMLVAVVQGSEYVSYVPGNMPLLITAPHGGDKNPSSFPERSVDTNAVSSRKYCGYRSGGQCYYNHNYDQANLCTGDNYKYCKVPYLKDSYTYTIATGLAAEIERLSGKRPHLVRMELKRNKIDANREVDEATFGASQTVQVYNEYAATINQAKANIGAVGLLLDIHGQSHSHGMVELGYTVSGSELSCVGASCFSPLTEPSIRSLVSRRCGTDAACAESILRGATSLGNYLSQKGYSVIPSPSYPGPDGKSYYSGGYTTKVYGSKYGGSFDAIQIEIPRHERFDSAARSAFIDDLAAAVVTFMGYHYGV